MTSSQHKDTMQPEEAQAVAAAIVEPRTMLDVEPGTIIKSGDRFYWVGFDHSWVRIESPENPVRVKKTSKKGRKRESAR